MKPPIERFADRNWSTVTAFLLACLGGAAWMRLIVRHWFTRQLRGEKVLAFAASGDRLAVMPAPPRDLGIVLGSLLPLLSCSGQNAGLAANLPGRGVATAEARPPATFPQRIWAACDFEGRTPDYGWFGPTESNNIPQISRQSHRSRRQRASLP